MKIIAKKFGNKFYVCLHADNLTKIHPTWPVIRDFKGNTLSNENLTKYPITFSFKNKIYTILSSLSEQIPNIKNNKILNENLLYWKDSDTTKQIYPFEQYIENRPAWILDKVFMKCLVERVV